jgi:chloramphenicol O-acetyltransferase
MNAIEKATHLYNIFGKELAIKCVEEILDSMPDYNIYKEDGSDFANAYTYYWKQVKRHIENER